MCPFIFNLQWGRLIFFLRQKQKGALECLHGWVCALPSSAQLPSSFQWETSPTEENRGRELQRVNHPPAFLPPQAELPVPAPSLPAEPFWASWLQQHLSLGSQGHLLWDRIPSCLCHRWILDRLQIRHLTRGWGQPLEPQPWEKEAFSVLDSCVISILLMSPLHCPLLLSFFVPILTLPRPALLSPHGTTHLPLLFLFLFFQSSPLLPFQHLGKDCNWKKYE